MHVLGLDDAVQRPSAPLASRMGDLAPTPTVDGQRRPLLGAAVARLGDLGAERRLRRGDRAARRGRALAVRPAGQHRRATSSASPTSTTVDHRGRRRCALTKRAESIRVSMTQHGQPRSSRRLVWTVRRRGRPRARARVDARRRSSRSRCRRPPSASPTAGVEPMYRFWDELRRALRDVDAPTNGIDRPPAMPEFERWYRFLPTSTFDDLVGRRVPLAHPHRHARLARGRPAAHRQRLHRAEHRHLVRVPPRAASDEPWLFAQATSVERERGRRRVRGPGLGARRRAARRWARASSSAARSRRRSLRAVEDRITPGLVPRDDRSAARRVRAPSACPRCSRCPGSSGRPGGATCNATATDLPPVLPEFDHLARLRGRRRRSARPAPPAGITGHHFRHYRRPGQGIVTGRPTIGLSLVLISPKDAGAGAGAARLGRLRAHPPHRRGRGARLLHDHAVRERRPAAIPRFMHFYEMDTDDPETAFKAMTPLVMQRIGDDRHRRVRALGVRARACASCT